MRALQAVAFSLVVLMVAATSHAQTGTSSIRGTVTDPQNRMVSGAKITLTNLATSAVRTTTSTEAGAYAFELITPGDYRVQVEAKGFKRQAVESVHALIGKAIEVSIQLEIGAVGEIVEVKASGQEALVNTQDASLGNNFVSSQITQLPLEARDVRDLLTLQPGSTREGYVNGARADQSNVTLDGVDINNAQTGNAEVPRDTNTLVIGQVDTDRGDITTGPVLRINAEAVEEFRVTTANANSNQGRSAGSQINLITKSGANAWHGAGFEFYRTKGFTANDWFNNHAGVPRQDLIRHTFGGAIGGPIVKNKAFFFYSYEGRHDARSQGVTRVVPLNNVFGDGTIGDGVIHYEYCTDADCTSTAVASLQMTPEAPGPYPVAGINQAALDVFKDAINKYPTNDSSQGDGLNTGGFRFNAPTPTRLNSHVVKLDFNLTNNQTAFLRTQVQYDHQTLPKWLPDSATPSIWSHPWGLAAGHVWTIGSRWVNNFRYGLTRQAFSEIGDSSGNDIEFRFVFQPTGDQHTLTRVTPVHNFTDDVSWMRGNHNIQFGVNIRKTNNTRVSFANAFDFATTNPSFYFGGGDRESSAFQDYLIDQDLPGGRGDEFLSSTSQVQNAATAMIGRLSDYFANFTFAKDGSLLDHGSPAGRDFATQGYEWYVQDTWKLRPSLTLTLGLRYSLERPVYETQGFEVQPETPLGTFFAQRLAAAAQGENFSDPIVINRSGPANGGKPMYNWDKNNFQPRIAFAWQPWGTGGKGVVRGGFAITNDYYGQALAVNWDLNNTLGFTSSDPINANTYSSDGSRPLAPLFTAFGQDVQSLPNIQVPDSLVFPLSKPLDFGEAIETGVDSNLHAPKEYIWNLTYEHQLPKGMLLSLSYVGRKADSLLARRDVTAFNNTVDPASGMDWYTAGTMLEKQRQQGIDTNDVAAIPYFENLFPAGLGAILNDTFGLDPICDDTDPDVIPGFEPTWSNTQVFYAMQSRTPFNPCFFFSGNDWTDTQALVDQVASGIFGNTPFPTRFMHPQYGALSAWSTLAHSNYNAFAISLRQRLSSIMFDFNYTFSHSLDNASGLQSGTGYATDAFIVNPIRPNDFYSSSSFDTRHSINADAVWQVPVGKGKTFLADAGGVADAILGGWQLSGIFRWNTGLPVFSPYDDARWATNWNVQANVTPTAPIKECPGLVDVGGVPTPKLFGGCGQDITAIYQGFRNAYPGETGPRNYLRLPGYVDVDLGLGKTWKLWHENHQLQARLDVFNVSNTQRFGAVDGSRTGFGVVRDPGLRGSTPPDNWGNFIQIQGQPRVMQVSLRYSF